MRWAAFGTYDVSRHPRVAVLIEGLRDSGDEVIEVNVPLRLDTAGRVAMLRQPWRLPVFAGKLLRCWTALWRASRRSGPVDAVLVGYLGHFDVRLARRLYPGAPIVLDHLVSAAGTARDRGLTGDRGLAGGGGLAGGAGLARGGAGAVGGDPSGASAGGVKARLMVAIDDGALRSADVVVVDTEEHRAALPPSVDAVTVPVGATREWFAVGAARNRGNPNPLGGVQSSKIALKAIFVGVFTPLHGTVALGEALALLADDDDIEVTMVGTGQDHAACRAAASGNPRVRWIDWVTSAHLPALVGAHDVSLGIFGTTPKSLNVVPTKVYQGAAAGCAVLTSDTPPQRAALPDAALFVPPGDPIAIAAALRTLAKDRAELARLGAAAAIVACNRYTPAAVVAPIRTRLREVT